MEHDPLCTARNPLLLPATICTPCQLIRAVRSDERSKSQQVEPSRWEFYYEGMPE